MASDPLPNAGDGDELPSASSNLPAPASRGGLDRRAVERILARAAELQNLDGGGESESELIGEQQIVEIAREAGLAETSVRQAIAEERTRVGPVQERGAWHERLSGPSVVSASRTIPGTPDVVLRVLDDWMQRDECLAVQRRFADRIVWEPRRDWVAAVKRGLGSGGRSYHLSRAAQIAATVVPVDERRSLVRLDADLAAQRTMHAWVAGTIGGTSTLAAGSAVAIGAAFHVAAIGVALAAAPVAIGGAAAYGLLRRHRARSQRVMLALEQVLDRLEYGETRRPGVLGAMFGAPRMLYR